MASHPSPALDTSELSSPYCSDPNCPYCADLRKVEEAVRRGGPLPLAVQKKPNLTITD
jgi:hypothetical protein